jgi:hypothetical protein
MALLRVRRWRGEELNTDCTDCTDLGGLLLAAVGESLVKSVQSVVQLSSEGEARILSLKFILFAGKYLRVYYFVVLRTAKSQESWKLQLVGGIGH